MGGATFWFSSVLESVQSAGGDLNTTPVRIDVRHAQLTFGRWPHTVDLPDSTIQLDPSATDPARWWVGGSAWSVTLAPSRVPEAFFDGAPYAAPEPFTPGESGPITWTATFTTSRPGITLTWAWSAAVYSKFGPNGALLVKPLSAPVGEPQAAMYQNNDPAGTPELYKPYVVAGAMGNGAPQYTGARSEPATVEPCVSAQPPAASSGMTPATHPTLRRIYTYNGARNGDSFTSAISRRCFTTDLCALIQYRGGDRVAFYSEGAAKCDRYVLYVTRTNGFRTIFGFSRSIASLCGGGTIARLSMDGGRIRLAISRNSDGSLKFDYFK